MILSHDSNYYSKKLSIKVKTRQRQEGVMFVSTVGKGKLERVYVFEAYREDGKTKKRIVERLGYLSDLTNTVKRIGPC